MSRQQRRAWSTWTRCRPGGGGGGDGDGGWDWGCGGLRLGFTLSFILAALTLYVALCVPGAATYWYGVSAAFALAAAVALGVWIALCDQPCGWKTLLAWQVALGSGIGALYFADCCPIMWAIGTGLIGTALGLLYKWKRDCGISACDVWAELLLVISGVVVPVVGYLALIPAFAGCLNPWVFAAGGTLATIVSVFAWRCLRQRDEEVTPIDDVRRREDRGVRGSAGAGRGG